MPHALLHESWKDNHEAQARALGPPRAPAPGRPRAGRPPPLEPDAGAELGPLCAPRPGSAGLTAGKRDANELEQFLPEDGLTADFLRHFCETDDLASVQQLQIQVDGVAQSIDTLGSMLPRLEQLKLTGSPIASVRELGTSLRNLQVLWLGRCGLRDLGGIASMECLRECYVPFNDVVDLYPLSSNEALEVLDVEGNGIADIDEVASLWICSQLTDLTLTGNPLCRDSSYSRSGVCKVLPQLKFLDGMEVGAQPASQKGGLVIDVTNDNAIEAALSMDVPFLEWTAHHMEMNMGSSTSSDKGCHTVEPKATSDGIELSTVDINLPELTHPLLAEALREAAFGPHSDLFADEPDEEELIAERLRQANLRQGAPAWAALENPWFPLERLERPQTCATARPASARSPSSALALEDHLRPSEEASSELTRGSPLSGTPLAAARQRRRAPAGRGERDPGIRALLRRHCGAPAAGSPSSGARARRAGAPDVRVHRPPTPVELRPQRSPAAGGVEQRLEALLQRRAAEARAAACGGTQGAAEAAREAEGKVMAAKAAPIEVSDDLAPVTSPSSRPCHRCATPPATPAVSSGQVPNAPRTTRQAGEGRPARKTSWKLDTDRSPQQGQVPPSGATPAAPQGRRSPVGEGTPGPLAPARAPPVPPPARSRSAGAAPARALLGALCSGAALGLAGGPGPESKAAARGVPGAGGSPAGGRGANGAATSPEFAAPRKEVPLESTAALYSVIDPCPNLPLHAQAMFLEQEAGLQHCLIAC